MANWLASLLPSHDLLTATLWIGGGAVAAAWITGRNAKLVKIAEHRQNWINALRDDLSEYLTEAEEIRDNTNELAVERDPLKRRAIDAAMGKNISKANVLRWKILLRLDLDEEDHLQLARMLDDMQKVSTFSEQPNLADKAADQARRVLKREWAAAKYGIWANLRLHLKRARRGLWSWITVRPR